MLEFFWTVPAPILTGLAGWWICSKVLARFRAFMENRRMEKFKKLKPFDPERHFHVVRGYPVEPWK